MKNLKLTIALLIIVSFIAMFTTNVYATEPSTDSSTTPSTDETTSTESSTDETTSTESSTDETTSTTPSTDEPTSTETTPEQTKVYTYEISSGGNYYQSESTHWNMYVPEDGIYANTYIWILEDGQTLPTGDVTDEMRVTSSDETILKILEDGSVMPVSVGTVDLIQCGNKVGKITVYANYEEWATKFDEFTGVPVIVVNDNVNNYITGVNSSVVSSSKPPKLEFKMLKDGKIVDLDSSWVLSISDNNKDIASLENGIITPKQAGSINILAMYSNQKSKNYTIYFEDEDTTKYDVQAVSQRGVTVKTEKGKEIVLEKGWYAYFAYFLDKNEVGVAHKDVYVKIADETIVKQGDYDNEILGVKPGTTTLTIERTGKAKETITVRVVDSIYKYKEENPELFPEDFEITEYEYIEEGKDYKELNTDLLDKADTLEVGFDDKKSTVKSNVFKELTEYENRNLDFWVYGNNFDAIWSFDSDEIKNTDIDFIPAMEISLEKFDDIKTDEVKDGIFIKFLHDGYLPGKAEVTLYAYEAWEKYGETEKTLNLYYYNPETADYENAGTVKYKDGILKFSIEHCSDYVATELALKGKVDKATMTDSDSATDSDRELDDEPKAGDNNIIVFSAFMAVTTLAGAVLLIKKY